MSEPSAELRPALRTWLKADTEVVASFGAKDVKVFAALPQPNTSAPYISISGFSNEDEEADCYGAVVANVQMDIWSLTSPPGFTEAETIAEAVKASLKRMEDTGDSPAFTLSSHRVVAVQLVSTLYLTEPSDGRTVHAVIQARLSIDPL
jgi:hypothetical protein